MLNEWKEFQDYTGAVKYTARNKQDTTYLGRFTFDTILDFEGLNRVLTILARGFLFHNEDGGLVKAPRERIDYAKRGLCAWCSVPDSKKATPREAWQFGSDFRNLHSEFHGLVDENGSGWFHRHVHQVVDFVRENPERVSSSAQKKCAALEKGFDRASPFYIPTTIANMGAGFIAIMAGFQGMCTCPVTACAGGSNAVGDAFRHIRDGYAEVMVAGGAEASITPLAMGGFTSMSALTDASDPSRASIPFDKERSGFVMGEGAAVLILEELEHARARGAQILGEITGYGATCDAYHITAPDPEGAWSAACMEQALADAGLAPEAVDYINAHGTSTPLNDSGETAAIRRVFGAHADRLMVSSTKSMTGHLLGASGAVEAALCVLALKDGFVPATINYQVPDPACDLDIVPNEGREADIRCAISNSLGFGGHNACLVFQKWEG